MSDERNPGKAYADQHYGEHPGRFEVEARTWRESNVVSLVEYVGDRITAPNVGRVTLEAFKPDARVTLRLSIGFATRDTYELDDHTMWEGDLLRVTLARTKIWLSECDSIGGNLRECGDLVGTDTVPVQMISDGNWGEIYEVDVDCKAVRARIDFAPSGCAGWFYAAAKWVAVSPMSDRDWMHARERMQVINRPKGLILFAYSPST